MLLHVVLLLLVLLPVLSRHPPQCAGRHFSLGKERNPPALQLKLAARDRNRAAPK
eukprot:COSAG06_NODE_10434_length_1679_cov_7.881795_1_plen_54_part_10